MKKNAINMLLILLLKIGIFLGCEERKMPTFSFNHPESNTKPFITTEERSSPPAVGPILVEEEKNEESKEEDTGNLPPDFPPPDPLGPIPVPAIPEDDSPLDWQNDYFYPICGDSIISRPQEMCDDGNDIDNDGCNSKCQLPRCGNYIVDYAEQCDDGNSDNADGCNNVCLLECCGNKYTDVDVGEQCDDGNREGCDGCSPTCTLEICGNGVIDCGEQCDNGDNCIKEKNTCTCDTASSSCSCLNGGTCQCSLLGQTTCTCIVKGCINTNCDMFCRYAICGDGIVNQPQEACDDGNLIGTDGCSSTCQLESCIQ